MNGLRFKEDDPELLAGLTPGTSQQMPQVPAPLPPMASATQVPPVPVQEPISAPPPNPIKLPGMPPSVTPDELEGYLTQKKGALNRFGPDEQMALQQKTMADRNSLGNRATSGLKGFADAIMMGVAGAGNPGWQKSFDDQQNLVANEQMNTLQNAQKSNIQQIEGNMSVDKMDPNSALSKAAQDNYGPILSRALGIPEAEIKRMSASQIQTNAELGLKFADIDAQKELKQATLDLQSMMGNANIKNQMSQRNQDAQKHKTDVASEILKRSGNAKFLGIPIPFTSDVSGKEEAVAKKALMSQLEEPSFSEEDTQALNWANSNPGDPRSAKIRERLGQ